MLQHYIGFTQIPYKLYSVSVDTQTFGPAQAADGFAGFSVATCTGGRLCPCGTGLCKPSSSILTMDVTMIIFLAACISFLGWFIFAIYLGIGFIALPMDCINAFVHRPKMLSVAEARNQRKALLKRSEELLKVGDEMALKLIEAQDGARSKKDRKNVMKGHKMDLNRFKLLVDMLEKDLEEFQLGDPQNYKQ